jgi:hypothetical protein
MSRLASVSGTLNVWDYNSSELNLHAYYKHPKIDEKFYCLSWNHTNHVLAVAGTDSKVSLLQADNCEILSSLMVSETKALHSEVHNISFSNNSRYLALSVSKSVQLWDLKRRQLKKVLEDTENLVSALCFISNGNIVTGNKSSSIRIWDSKNYNPISILKKQQGNNDINPVITALQSCPINSNYLASSYDDGSLGIWDLETFQLIHNHNVHTCSISSLSYSPKNSKLVATAGIDGKLSLVDTLSKGLNNSSSAVIIVGSKLNSVSFNEDAIHSAVATNDGRILVYDWRNVRKPVCSVIVDKNSKNPIFNIAFQVSFM